MNNQNVENFKISRAAWIKIGSGKSFVKGISDLAFLTVAAKRR